MKTNLTLIFLLVLTIAGLSVSAETPAMPSVANTNTDAANGYLQIQQQLHEMQLALEQSRVTAADEAANNAEVLATRLQALEQTVTAQRSSDLEAARKSQQLTLMLAGAFGLAGLGIMLLMVYFQWRAFTQITEISAQHQAQLVNAGAVHQLAAPGRATVETSNARLLDVVDHLEKRIHELESGQRMLPEIAAVKSTNQLDEGQKLLDADQPQPALDFFEKFLAAQPNHAEALVKKALALEKLGRTPEALACCDRAIALDGKLVIAHLHKGGLLNRLRRYDEALNCYEHALQAQEKKAAPAVS